MAALPNYVGVQEIADYFNVTPTTIRNWTKQKLLPHIRIGSQCRYDLNEVLKTAKQNA